MVTPKKLIICEGSDDEAFLKKFLIEYLNYSKNSFQIVKMGGKSSIFALSEDNPSILNLKIGQYDKLLIVLDSDFSNHDAVHGGFDNTANSTQMLISRLGLDGLSNYYICCDPHSKDGNLEHLLLSAAETNKRECIETFINCIEKMDTESNKKIVLTAYKQIFKEHPYNFEHPNFELLKQKIIWLFS